MSFILNRSLILGVLVVAGSDGSVSQARTVADGPAFEVATIKLHDMRQPAMPVQIDPAYVRFIGQPLLGLLTQAYRVQLSQIDAPAWMKEAYFDIVAKLPEEASRDQVPAMLQKLLEERLRLRVHWSPKEEWVYLVVVKKPGLLKRSAEGEEKRIHFSLLHGHIEASAITIAELAELLTSLCSDRPIIDQAASPERFDFAFDVGREGIKPSFSPRPKASDDSTEPVEDPTTVGGGSLFRAIRLLGLDLKPTKVRIQHLQVDSADKTPSPEK